METTVRKEVITFPQGLFKLERLVVPAEFAPEAAILNLRTKGARRRARARLRTEKRKERVFWAGHHLRWDRSRKGYSASKVSCSAHIVTGTPTYYDISSSFPAPHDISGRGFYSR